MFHAHGAIQWLAADVATTTYTVSGLPFQPKAIRFYWVGLQDAADAVSEAVSERRGVGFAVSISSRRAVATFSSDTAATSLCGSVAADDCCVCTVDGAGARDGELDLDAILSDGFRLIVDDAAPANITVFWEAWGGDDITVAVVGDIAEPAATGNQDYTVTGFVVGATDQVVMFAGVQSTAAVNTGAAVDSGFHVGFASSGTAADNITVCGNSDDGSNTMDTDGYCKTGECLSMIVSAGGNPNARAQLTQFGTDNFRLNWIARGATGRRNIFLAIKGGFWKAGSYTIDGNTGAATATVTALGFKPIGLSLIGRMTAEQAEGLSSVNDIIGFGSGSSTSSRRSMGILDEDATASSACEINTTIQYDQALSFPSTAGGLQSAYDINAMNADGFEIIVDTAGGVASEWQGYLTFGPLLLAPNVSDSDLATESVTIEFPVNNLTVSVSDTDAATEFIDIQRNPLLAAVSDDDVGTEAVTVTISMQVVVSDDDIATEAIAVTVNPLVPSVFDDTVAAEAITVVVNPLNFVVFDSISSTEDITIQRNPLLVTVSDTDTVTEEIAVVWGQPFGFDVFSDSVIADEFVSVSLSAQLTIELSVFDAVTPTEDVTVHISMQIVVFDTDTPTEDVVVAIGTAIIVFDDDVVTELVAVTVNPLTLAVFDSDIVTESVIAAIPITAVVFDTVSITEAIDIQRSPLLVDVFDDDVATEFIDVRISMQVAVDDSTVVAEAIAGLINPLVPAVLDDVISTEAVLVTVNPLVPSVFDDAVGIEDVTVHISVMPSVFDDETITESVTLTLNPVQVSVSDDDVASEFVAVVVNPLFVFVSDDDQPTEEVLISTGQVVLISAVDILTTNELVSVFINPLTIDVSDTDNAAEIVRAAMILPVVVFDANTVTEQGTIEIAVLLEISVIDSIASVDQVAATITPLFISVSDDVSGADVVDVRKSYTIQISDDVLEPAELVQILLTGLGPIEIDVNDSDSISERRLVLSIPVSALHVGNDRIRETTLVNQVMVL